MMRNMNSSNRIEWIDLVRGVAILCVILCHSSEGVYPLNMEYIPNASLTSKLFAFGCFTIGRLGVPFFLMISGYLLLDRTYDKEKTVRFWKKNWLHLLICTEIWFVIYEIFQHLVYGDPLKPLHIMEEMLFIRPMNINHVWYMPMILGMYVLFPFVANVLKQISKKLLIFPLLVFGFYYFIYPLIKVLLGAFHQEPPTLQFSMGFSGGTYGIYFILGYLVKKKVFQKVPSGLLMVISILSYAAGIGMQIWSYGNGFAYNILYDNPFILACTLSLFVLASRIKKVYLYGVVRFLSYYSFPVYLIHNMIRKYTVLRLGAVHWAYSVKTILTFITAAVLAYLIAWLINRIPKVGNFVLYTK